MPTWPIDLPRAPLIAGFSLQPKLNISVFSTEVGVGKRRRRSTARVTGMPFSMYVDRSQRDSFIAFFNDDLEDGALAFDLDDPETGFSASFQILAADPPYTAAAIHDDLWLVSMQLQRLP